MTPDPPTTAAAHIRALEQHVSTLEARLARRRCQNLALRRQLGRHATRSLPPPREDDAPERNLY